MLSESCKTIVYILQLLMNSSKHFLEDALLSTNINHFIKITSLPGLPEKVGKIYPKLIGRVENDVNDVATMT